MITYSKYAGLGNVGNPDFDWSLYEDGWNGTSLKVNKKVKTKNSSEKIYSPHNIDREGKMENNRRIE